jgi:hypothetical protein
MMKLKSPTEYQCVDWSIDPGITGCGIAIWRIFAETFPHRLPLLVKNIYPKSKLVSVAGLRPLWVEKVWSEMAQIEDLEELHGTPRVIHCEIPHYMEGATADASNRTSSLGKLFSHVGAVQEFARQHQSQFLGYEVNQWKGQLPKTVVIQRIRRLLPEIDRLKVSSHGWDATGIGLYGQGWKL